MAAPLLRAPDASYEDQLIDDDDDVTEILPACIALARVVDQVAAERLTCCARGPSCEGNVPRDLVTMSCPHALCRACFDQMRTVLPDDEVNLTCPTCRVSLPVYASGTNHGLMGQIAGLVVRCKDPRCKVTYTLDANFRGETVHQESVCLYSRVPPCPDCGAVLTRGESKNHPRLCPNRTKDCGCCGERVRVTDWANHIGDGRCTGMVPCPYGCVEDGKQPSSSKLRRLEEEGKTSDELVFLRPSQLDAHKLHCPCRPVCCPFGEVCPIGDSLVHHELDKHVTKRKFAGAHLAGLLQSSVAERKAAADREAHLQAQIHALQPQRQVNPLPGYTRVYQSVMHLPASVCTEKVWPAEYPRFVDVPLGMAPGVSRVGLNVLIETDPLVNKRNKRSRASLSAAVAAAVRPPGKMLHVDVDFVPDIHAEDEPELEVRQRKMGIVVTLLRAFRPGTDSNSMLGACTDAGVYLDRMVTEFTNYANIARPGFDVFECQSLVDLPDESGARSAGFRPHYFIGLELFERFEAAAAQ